MDQQDLGIGRGRSRTRATGWMVAPFAEVRHLGRCLGEKEEEVIVGHAEFQVAEELPAEGTKGLTWNQKQDLAEIAV